ncbi:chaperone NapD [Vibrio sp. SM6]|uniref:Chaperone NapD n=1 Tax=Vibrio agarilyticus TaxID=2726741 RepID=A0A7X8TM73_9VIBR|nr:chaperone NapD [Vibrio agarilyticus]NLS11337.1 chaperone NapD [Vibrio agarilyticus]
MSGNHEVHISSLVIHARPEQLTTLKTALAEIPQLEIYGENAEGKLVVVLETQTHGFITTIIDQINQLPSVLSVVMVYHQIEFDEPMMAQSTQSSLEGAL